MKNTCFFILTIFLLSGIKVSAQDTLPATDSSSAVRLLKGKLINTQKMDTALRNDIEDKAKKKVRELSSNLKHLWTPYTEEEKKKISLSNRLRYKHEAEKDIWHLFIADADSSFYHSNAYYIVENGYYEKGESKIKATNPEWLDSPKHGRCLVQHVEEDVVRLPATIELTSVGKRTTKTRPIKQYTENIINLVVKSDMYKSVEYDVPDAGINISHNLHQVDENLWEGTIEYYQDFRSCRREGGTYIDRTYRTIKIYVSVIRNPDGSAYIDVRLGDIKATATEKPR